VSLGSDSFALTSGHCVAAGLAAFVCLAEKAVQIAAWAFAHPAAQIAASRSAFRRSFDCCLEIARRILRPGPTNEGNDENLLRHVTLGRSVGGSRYSGRCRDLRLRMAAYYPS